MINIPYNETKFNVSKQMSKYFAIVFNFVFLSTQVGALQKTNTDMIIEV